MKKTISLLLTAMMLFVLVAACNNNNDDSGGNQPVNNQPANTNQAADNNQPADNNQSADDNQPAGPGGLNLAIFEGGYGPDFWHAISEMFEAETGVTVNLQISPNIGETIRPQIVAGNVPDFMNLSIADESGIVASMIAERALMNLNDVFDGPQFDSPASLRDKIIPGFLESNQCAPYGDGNIFLAPGAGGPMGLVYNITLFEEKGWDLPVTWDDFFALGELAKAEGMSLFTYQGMHPGYMESVLLPALASALGSDYARIEDFTPGIWTDPRVMAVLEKIEHIYTSGNLMPGTVGLNHTQSQAAQMMNEALFIPNGVWMEGEMADADRAPGYRFGLTPPPVMNRGDTRYVAAYVENFSIPAGAPNAENAKLFLRFLYTDEAVRLYAQLNDGAVMVTNNALELVQPYLTEGVYGMFGAFTEPGAAALIFGFAAPPEGTIIVYKDEIFNPIGDVMSGRMTALDWAQSMNQAYQDMADGR